MIKFIEIMRGKEHRLDPGDVSPKDIFNLYNDTLEYLYAHENEETGSKLGKGLYIFTKEFNLNPNKPDFVQQIRNLSGEQLSNLYTKLYNLHRYRAKLINIPYQ